MPNGSTERGSLVVTGSSAGGIEALSVLFGGLPATFRAPIVVAQHLDPSVTSSLAAILAKATPMRVVAVESVTKLEPGTIFVVPADRHVEITDDHVRVHVDGLHGRSKPSIDLLFASAAEAYGDRLIAVVLTGLGSDGSDGARAVKRHGGFVIVEDPMTASFPSMPASLEPAIVDAIVPIGGIAAELVRLVDESIDLPELPILNEVFARVRAANGIDFSHYKPATIKRRLARQMALTGKDNIAEYLALLAKDPLELAALANSFLIKVTEFFRDRELFDGLAERIIPELVDDAHSRRAHELRFWSAGCATGEEAYSLAILLAEKFRGQGDTLSVRIFATDIDEAAISFGRRGVYPPESIAGLDPELVARYFTRTDDGWEVVKSIRNMTVFGQHDLAQRAPFPRIDLALCRNVLIYFSKELQLRTLQIFAFSLRNGGYLVLGKSETTNPFAQHFAVVNQSLRIFRRYGDRVTIPSAQPPSAPSKVRDPERLRPPFPAFDSGSRDGRMTINEKLGAFLTNSSIGVILVDRHYDIQSINAAARVMFSLHGVTIGDDLVHLVPPETSVQVRPMLDSALRNQEPTAGGEEIEVRVDTTEAPRYLTLACYPEAAPGSAVSGAVILAIDVTEMVRARHDSLLAVSAQTREIEELRRFAAHARERQRSLVDANQQLAQVNSELRAQNDALVISAEEAQAATEEIETLNEEMQATNEELETLNEEFQATIEELNTTNDENEGRSRELEGQLALRDDQRRAAERTAAALEAIADGLPAAVAVVDAQGTIIAANRAFREIENGATENSVQIDDDSGATIPLRVVLRRAGEGAAFSFTYRAISTDQIVKVQTGRARPIADGGEARGIIELVPSDNVDRADGH